MTDRDTAAAQVLPNTFIYLLGVPGTGKYTVAQILAAEAGFRIVDNHLINNPVFTVVRVDGKTALPREIWGYAAEIGRVVFDCIRKLSPPHFSFVLTNALYEDDPQDHEWFTEIADLAADRGALFVPVRLVLTDAEEHRRRVTHPQREQRMKETDPGAPERYAQRAVLRPNHPHLLTLDVTHLGAQETAEKILSHAALLRGDVDKKSDR